MVLMSPVLPVRKAKASKDKRLAQGHTAGKWHLQEWNTALLILGPVSRPF